MGYPQPMLHSANPRRQLPLLLATLSALLLSALAGAPLRAETREEQATLLRQLREGSSEERRFALAELAERGTAAAVPTVVTALRDQDLRVRAMAERTLWGIWSRSGDEEVDRLLRIGTSLLARGRLAESVSVFDSVVDRAPNFAEGYNKRATAYYHIGAYQDSLRDIDAVLARNPYHFGALSGAGLCLLRLERPAEALDYFDRALAINPNLDGIVELRDRLRKHLGKTLI